MTNHTLSITLYHQSEETRHETREACVLIGTLSKGGRGVSLISLTYGGPRPTPPHPPYQGQIPKVSRLTDEEIEAVAAYVLQQADAGWPPQTQ